MEKITLAAIGTAIFSGGVGVGIMIGKSAAKRKAAKDDPKKAEAKKAEAKK